VTPDRHGTAVIEYPSELEILTTREFDAPVYLVLDVLTKPEHVRHWFAPFEAGRGHLTRTDGQEDSLDELEDYLRSLVEVG
jgi:uncharacterized protein YndB with AHSA1/START domain